MLWSKVDLFFKGDTWQIIVVVKNVIKSILQKSYGSLSLWKYKMYKFKYLYLKNIYILQNIFHSKTARESKPKIRQSCVPNLRLISQKMCFQVKFVWA